MNKTTNLFEFKSTRDFLPYALILGVIAAATAQLFHQGRILWCKQGDYAPWSSDVVSSHNSQHLFDPYTFTHVLHGILFYWIISFIFPRMSFVWQLLIAVTIESAWEVLENTNMVIERYRTATISLDYYGDSVINSLGDIFSCAVGFVIAWKLKLWRSLAFFVLTELILILWIRDSLLINIIMLIYPIDALKNWQNGG